MIHLSSGKIKSLNNFVFLHGFDAVWRAYCTIHCPKAGERCEEAALRKTADAKDLNRRAVSQ